MINSIGIIQNNACVTDFIRKLKSSNVQYKTLTKKEERKIIEKYFIEDREEELIELLIMHNIRMVFSIAKRYCKETRDFDNMVAKGLYGLVFAANTFNLFEPIMYKKQVGTKIVRNEEYPYNPIIDPETGLIKEEPIYEKFVKINPKTNKPDFVKFCTYANNWIFKYVMDEFNDRSIIIDNNSVSIDDKVKIKNSYDNNQTMENYVDSMISPDYNTPKTTDTKIAEKDLTDFYNKIGEFVSNTNELTAMERNVVLETFYNHKKTKDIALDLGESAQKIITTKKRALLKLKRYISKNFNISNLEDILV